MKRFKQYIKEETSAEKLLHLSHLEDLPIEQGKDGINKVLGLLGSIINKLNHVHSEDIDIKTKFDGAPSLIVGTNPENGKFFVGTKSVFNKLTPKLNYSFKDIEQNHESPELQKKLKYALKYLKLLDIKGVLQGDLMFIAPDIKEADVTGNKSYVFRPNTITYAVDKDSKLGRKVKRAKIGIVFHTQYNGKTMKSLSADLHPDLSKLHKTPDVWFEDANFQMVNTEPLDSKLANRLHKDMNDLRFAFDQIDRTVLDKLEHDNELQQVFLNFINFLVRTDNNKKGPKEKIKLFVDYVEQKYSGQASTRKTDASKLRLDTKMKYVKSVVKDNLKTFVLLLGIHRIIADIKMIVVDSIPQKDDLKSYLEKDNRYIKTKPEGFVAASDSYGNIKLIDRDSFSKENFNLPKNWDKEGVKTESVELEEWGMDVLDFGFITNKNKVVKGDPKDYSTGEDFGGHIHIAEKLGYKDVNTAINHDNIRYVFYKMNDERYNDFELTNKKDVLRNLLDFLQNNSSDIKGTVQVDVLKNGPGAGVYDNVLKAINKLKQIVLNSKGEVNV